MHDSHVIPRVPDWEPVGGPAHTDSMRTLAAVVTSAALAFGALPPAEAATRPRIGGPCKKVHQVDWIKNIRAQCTWVPVKGAKKGKLIWKALPQPKLTATKQELQPQPETGTATTDTQTVTVETPTVTETPTTSP